MQFRQLLSQLPPDSITGQSLENSPQLDPEIKGVAAVDEAEVGQLSYIEGAKFAGMVGDTKASALILPPNEELQSQATARGIAWLSTKEPRLVFAYAIALFYQPFRPQRGIHETAVIHPSAVIGKEVYIGAHAVVEEGVEIGDRVAIFPNVVVYPGVEIGEGTVLHANCTIHERSKIGANCFINSGAVIGGEGFGFVPTPQGWYKMQQSGRVVLEDLVEIACNTTIDRPAVGETRIARDTKLDNLVQVGHGCQIGSGCVIAAQTGMAGGVKLGNQVILAGQVGIANQAKIGNGAIATAKSGIHSDVADGEIVGGIPAISYKLFLKVSAVYQRLPEIYKTIREVRKLLKK